MDNKKLFYSLGSILIILMIFSMFGIIGNEVHSGSSKEVVVKSGGYYYPPVYYPPPYVKGVVYAPDVYIRPNPYKRRYYN